MPPNPTAKAIELAAKIDHRAQQIANDIRLEVALHCGSRPEFMAIMLEAVERKIAALCVQIREKVPPS
jgi:hypothetical protein